MRQDRNKRRRGPRLIDRLCLLFSTAEHVDGLWVGTVADKPEPILLRLREALSLIKAHDRLRYERLTRDLKRVWALPIHHPTAYFDHRLDACMLNKRFVLAEVSTPELIAAMIVHEATHARLWGCGIGYQEDLRPRVEAICVRRELAFSAKLPNGQEAREWAEYSLASYANYNNLTNASLDRRHLAQTIEELRDLGLHPWVVRMVPVLRSAIRGFISLFRLVTRYLVALSRRDD